jgi:hypothetical protein
LDLIPLGCNRKNHGRHLDPAVRKSPWRESEVCLKQSEGHVPRGHSLRLRLGQLQGWEEFP